MLWRNLDQDQDQAVGVRHPRLDQSPGFRIGALDDGNPSAAQLLLRLAHIANLEPELGRRRGGVDAAVGKLQVPPAEKEDHSARLASAELPHGMKTEDVAIEAHAAVEVARVEQKTAGKYLHRARVWSLHCPATNAGYISAR